MTTTTTNGHADTLSPAWHVKAEALSAWARERVFVRTDRWGGYYRDRDGNKQQITNPTTVRTAPFSDADLLRHFRAKRTEDVLGAHPLVPGETESFGIWAAAELDNHGPPDCPERNKRYAEHLHQKLETLGFRPLVQTWGTGGYHITVFFDRSVPGRVLYAFGKWMVRDAKDFDYPKDVESFPKQEHVPADGCGNWLRVPGRHHSREAFAAVFDGSAWVEGEDAVEHILGMTGDSPDLIPEAAAPPEEKKSEPNVGASQTKFTARATSAPDGRDVFAEYNRTVSLDTVVSWHTDRGHTVTARKEGRVELLREGKKGKGQSFNVQVFNSVPVTYNFSTNAGLPEKKGLSPSQMRCLYETGSCDTAAMAAFAKVLRTEMGWDKEGEKGSGGQPSAGPDFPFGPLTIRPAKPRQTDGGKIVVGLTLLRDGKPIDRVQLNDSAGGRRSAAALIAKHDGVGDKEHVERVLSSILAWAVEQLNRPPETPTGDTVRAIVAARVPEMLRFTYRTARGLWSEAEGREFTRADLMGFVPSELLTAAAAGSDAPDEFRPLLGSVKDALEVLWSDLRRTMKPATEVEEDTPARQAFLDAVVRVWKTMRTWEAPRDGDKAGPARRVSLAGIVQRDSAHYTAGAGTPRGRAKWEQVRQDVNAYWRPVKLESGGYTVLLAMQYPVAEQLGVTIPEADNEDLFAKRGRAYGIFTDTSGVSERLTDGCRLSVIDPGVSAKILATVADDPPEPGSTDT